MYRYLLICFFSLQMYSMDPKGKGTTSAYEQLNQKECVIDMSQLQIITDGQTTQDLQWYCALRPLVLRSQTFKQLEHKLANPNTSEIKKTIAKQIAHDEQMSNRAIDPLDTQVFFNHLKSHMEITFYATCPPPNIECEELKKNEVCCPYEYEFGCSTWPFIMYCGPRNLCTRLVSHEYKKHLAEFLKHKNDDNLDSYLVHFKTMHLYADGMADYAQQKNTGLRRIKNALQATPFIWSALSTYGIQQQSIPLTLCSLGAAALHMIANKFGIACWQNLENSEIIARQTRHWKNMTGELVDICLGEKEKREPAIESDIITIDSDDEEDL